MLQFTSFGPEPIDTDPCLLLASLYCPLEKPVEIEFFIEYL